MRTCSTCKHWRVPNPVDPEWDAPSVMDPYGRCSVAESKDGAPVVPLAPACAMDESGYHAALCTLPTFSCVLHEDVLP